MRNIYTFLLVVLSIATAVAQSPNKMSYQAVIRDGSNTLVVNKMVGMRISIIQGTATGTAVFVETHTPSTNANGLVSIEIGGGAQIIGTFANINWANGPYFVKTETDPTGGTNYTITGTSQLLSVPYALHAKTAESIAGGINEIDPIFNSSLAKSITAIDTTNWNNKLGSYTENDPLFNASISKNITALDTARWNNKLSSYAETDPLFNASLAKNITALDTSKWSNKLSSYKENQNLDSVLTINNSASNKNITNLANPVNAQDAATKIYVDQLITSLQNQLSNILLSQYPSGSTFCSSGPTQIVPIFNPITGKTWMDRNLGASRAATSLNDSLAYGDLYQWGRRTDGHQCRNSLTTSNISSTDTPVLGYYVLTNTSPFDWRSPQNTNLWQGINGINNPCPSGYRIPTDSELDAERLSWLSNDMTGAFSSPLRFTASGARSRIDGSFYDLNTNGRYWSSTINNTNSRGLNIFSSNSNIGNHNRTTGYSVRCIKN